MLTIREKRRRIKAGKLALLVVAAVIILTPKDFNPLPNMSFPGIGQALAAE
jgi:hypothetical protein